MKSGNINEIVNKGVPTSQTILISLRDLINLSENKRLAEKEAKNVWSEHNNNLQKIIGGIIPFPLYETLCVVIDKKTLEKKIIFSPDCIMGGIAINLNLFNDAEQVKIGSIITYTPQDKKNMGELIEDKLKELRLISNERKLAKKFPYLYHAFMENNAAALELFKLRLNAKNELEYIRTLKKYGIDINTAKELKMFEDCGSFIEGCITIIRKITSKLEILKEFIENDVIDLSKIKIDEEKLNLYIAYNNLIMAEEAETIEKKQSYLYYLSHYFNEYGNDGDISIILGEIKDGMEKHRQQGLIITKKEVHDRYSKLLVDNPELRIVDFSKEDFKGMTLEQVDAFMSGYLKDLQATWDFLTSNKELDKDVVDKIRNNRPKKTMLTEEEIKARQDRLIDLYIEKKEVFDKSNPLYRIKGKKTFDGYIGYIYENGKVILEKFFENSRTGRVSNGNAIYVMDIKELVILSKLSKTELIENELCSRIVHNGDWAEKVQAEINSNGENTQKDVIEKILKNCEIK